MSKAFPLIFTILLISSCDRSSNSESVTQTNPPQVSATAPQSYANVVDRVSPAVITIHSERRTRAAQQFPFHDDPFFRWLFGNRGPRNDGGEGQGQVERALGSGVIV